MTAHPIPFHRLVSVEARKLVDTRVSMVLLAVLLALTVTALVARGVAVGPDLFTVLGTAGVGYDTLLPVVGILSVTNEWSQRTALTTFTLEPRRARLLAAKCLPPLLLAVAASGFAMLVALPVTAVAATVQGASADWDVTAFALLGWTAVNVLLMAAGLAVGMLLLNAPAAIVICLSTTILWSTVSLLGEVGTTAAEWLDLGRTTGPLITGDLGGGELARLVTSMLFWIAAPLTLGIVRVVRREVR